MTPADRAEYIVACIRKGGAMYPEDAEQFLAEHDAHNRAEVLAEVAVVADRLIDDLATGRVGGGSVAFWQIDGIRMLKEKLTGDGGQATRGEPGKVASGDGQFDRTDWVSCSHRACPNCEYRAKAAERGWHQGPIDAWLCTTHAPGGGQ